jgi:hypothetical protein
MEVIESSAPGARRVQLSAQPGALPIRYDFSPLSLSPALWLDFSDQSTLFDATTGGSPVAANGAIARVEDKSGNGRHATQGTLNNRPLRRVGVQNGRDVADFNGVNNVVATSSFGGTQDFTMFVVFNDNSLNSLIFLVFLFGSFPRIFFQSFDRK